MQRSYNNIGIVLFAICLLLGSSKMAKGGPTLDDWSFDTVPFSIDGAPGETIGWGYTLSNLSTSNWLFVLDVVSSNLFTHATATRNPFDYPILSPGATVTVPYDGVNGLADLIWDAGTPDGFINSGLFTLTGYFYDDDPFNGGMPVGDAQFRSSPYSATVVAPNQVPEPGLASLLLAYGLSWSIFVPNKPRKC